MHAECVCTAHNRIRASGFCFDFDEVAGKDEGDFIARAVLEPALVPKGGVTGIAVRQEGIGYAIGVRTARDSRQNDVVERLADLEVFYILGH